MRGSRKFCQRGSKVDCASFFLVDEGLEDPNTTVNEPSSSPPDKRHINMAGGPIMTQH